MSDDPGVIDKGWDALPDYTDKPGDGEDAVTVSISTTPGEWLVNTTDAVVVPMSMIEVVEALRSQKLNERSLVWRAGMQEWAPVEKVPQLMLAARMPSIMPPPSSGPARTARTTRPPPKPARSTPPPAGVTTLPSFPSSAAPLAASPSSASAVIRTPLPPPPSFAARAPVGTEPLASRRATLPFGMPTLATSASRPTQSRPTPRPALPPPGPDDSEVLAVYDRPAATISFDLVPEVPARTVSAPSPLLPQTLAPTTTDNAPRRSPVPPPRNADLSVVAARDFRQAQQFSKRLIVASSVGSALVASLLTLWLSRGAPPRPAAAPAPQPVQALTQAAPPVSPPPPAVSPPEPVATAEAATPEPSAKPKAKRKARAWRPPAKAAPATGTTDEPATTEPKAEPNPYDVQLEEEAPKTPPPTPSLDLESIIRAEANQPGS
ncbi:MAG: hypothetical protein EOO73_27850 [Myxococcales bacterium]|nr:MAG: hypothetical protein EOO73_27850 [Myxococcales bacterium]